MYVLHPFSFATILGYSFLFLFSLCSLSFLILGILLRYPQVQRFFFFLSCVQSTNKLHFYHSVLDLWHFFFLNFIFNWQIVALQYCTGFYQTSAWISHRFTPVPSHLNIPPTSLLDFFFLRFTSLLTWQSPREALPQLDWRAIVQGVTKSRT